MEPFDRQAMAASRLLVLAYSIYSQSYLISDKNFRSGYDTAFAECRITQK